MAEWFRNLKTRFSTVHISCSYRGQEEQDKAFNQKKSNLPYPFSKHNYTDKDGLPCAQALDLFLLSEDGIAQFPYDFYKRIYDICLENKDSIRWGGTFKNLGDANHFELKC